MIIDLIAGARPNFVKIAALIHANDDSGRRINFRLIHTGQHYDKEMSGDFFNQLRIPSPDFNFGVGSGTQAEQTAAIMIAYEKVLQVKKPALCIVVGDVTSSMACAITAKKMKVKVAHIEAGIRSNDKEMPEEINRIIIDSVSDYFFTTTQIATKFLVNSDHPFNHIFFVGNTMIDTLNKFEPHFQEPPVWKKLSLKPQGYILLTLHRPGNLENKKNLKDYLANIEKFSRELPVLFPIHPRTAKALKDFNIDISNYHTLAPMSYLEFNFLVKHCKAVITDSGGITEETTVMGIPCITIRESTERPETITEGTNELIGTDPAAIGPALEKLFEGKWKKGSIPEKWDGKAAARIIEVIYEILS